MELDQKEIERIANLSRLKLSSDEKKKYSEQLSAVLDYMKILDELEIQGVEETCQVTGLKNVYREDEAVGCGELIRNNLISAFSNTHTGQLKVREVFTSELIDNQDES